MRHSRSVWPAFAVLSLIWTATVVRGDQPPDQATLQLQVYPSAETDPANETGMSAMGQLATLARAGRLDKFLNRPDDVAGEAGDVTPVDDPGGEDGANVGPAGGQAETSIAVDSSGMHVVIGFNDTRGFALNPLSVSGFMYSDDGGVTFTDGGQLPTPATDLIGTTKYPQVFGDPEIKYLGGSTFVYFSIMVKRIGSAAPFGTAQTMCVHRSTDNGHTWQGPFEIPAATNPGGLLVGPNARAAADKEFADVDPDSGRVLMSWSNFTGRTPSVQISTTYSDDLKTASVPSWSTQVVVASGGFDGQASVPRFAGNGSSNVYVAWQQSASVNSAGAVFGVNRIGFARSVNNGASFQAPITLTTTGGVVQGFFKAMDQVLGNDRVHTFPAMAVDNSSGANKGTLYVAYAVNASNDGADVLFQKSIDGGLSFSGPVAINSRPSGDRAQWFPAMAVDNLSGRLYVFYLDQGIRSAGDLSEVTVQSSDDGGVTWSKAMPLTDRPFHAGYGNDTGQPNLGDYNQAVAQNGELFAVFAATTPVGYRDGQPSSGSMTTPDVVFKRMPASTSKVPLSLQPTSFADAGGNGFIDPGEAVGFTLPLFSYYANLGAVPVTGISATLSSSTAGVTVVHPTQSYPVIAPGATANNAAPFDVQLAPDFVAGTPIEFSLAVSSVQGSTTLLFRQATGTPVTTTLLSEDFEGAAPGTLPAGWSAVHSGGNNTVPWTTAAGFMGNATNAAFHINANDGLSGNHTRFERLFSPTVTIPANSEYVLLDFDVAYNAEDDPNFNVLAYDGLVLRITDLTAGNILRSVAIEAFAEEFTTGNVPFYPKHMPRSGAAAAAYLQDLSAWSGSSGAGSRHVHLKLPGMAGTTVQLRWEYTQDSIGTCSDTPHPPPAGTPCGVAFDNILMQSAVSVAGTQTTVASSQNPSDSGEPVTFTATVTSNKPVSGQVTFKEGATILAGPTAVDPAGHASFTTSSLAPGSHTIAAAFSDGPGLAPSSGSVVQTVDALPAFVISDVSLAEGNAGTSTAMFTVTLSAATHTATARVDFATADNTATVADHDYAAGGGTLAFAPGEAAHTIVVAVNGDNTFEPDETFFVNLSNAAHATIADAQGQGTIVNDDPMPAITISAVTVVEGNSGSTPATFTVSLSNPSSSAVSVSFATADGTATTANHDYAAASGSLLFAPHETSKTISVSVFGDFVIEPNETFSVNLTAPSNATIADGQGIGTIQNDDTVATTLAALIDQANRAPRIDDRVDLLEKLLDVQRNIQRNRGAKVIEELRDFIEGVRELTGSRECDKRPRLDPATAAVWIAEAQSIIATLSTT